MMLREIMWARADCKYAVLILPVGGSTNNRFRVITCHFHKKYLHLPETQEEFCLLG
jgi:hypothetical protein